LTSALDKANGKNFFLTYHKTRLNHSKGTKTCDRFGSGNQSNRRYQIFFIWVLAEHPDAAINSME